MLLCRHAALLLLAVAFAVPAVSKSKKPAVSAFFQHATYAHVESQNGDSSDPRVFREDREAIADVEAAIQKWGRYTLTPNPAHAELLFVVRRGSTSRAQPHVGIPAGASNNPITFPPRRPASGQPTDPAQDTGPGVESESGSALDQLTVYAVSGDGSRIGPIWSGALENGLLYPGLRLFRQLRDQVDAAYPPAPLAQPSHP